MTDDGCRIQVTGSGNFSPSSTVSFPGAYSASDPGILISIYDNTGNPFNGGRPYQIPGPAVINCAGSGNGNNPDPTTPPAPTPTGGSGAPLYGQCGGNGWNGPFTCAQGRCVATNEWYSKWLLLRIWG